MNQEIERKFLVEDLPSGLDQYRSFKIRQGYLANDKNLYQVRVRAKDDKYTLTLKRGQGLVRDEQEIRITEEQFNELWRACNGCQLSKTRYEIPYGKYTIELDFFEGSNQGIVFAEVEFTSEAEAQKFAPPDWFAAEITGNSEYSNFKMAK